MLATRGTWRGCGGTGLTGTNRGRAEGRTARSLRLTNDADRDRRQEQERNHRRTHHHDRQRAAGRVNPDHGSGPGEQRPHPVSKQREGQLDRWQPRADTHPALLAQPAQGRRPLIRREPGQQVNHYAAAMAFSLTV
jgi:hypothetical protein